MMQDHEMSGRQFRLPEERHGNIERLNDASKLQLRIDQLKQNRARIEEELGALRRQLALLDTGAQLGANETRVVEPDVEYETALASVRGFPKLLGVFSLQEDTC